MIVVGINALAMPSYTKLVAVAGSAGSFSAMQEIVSGLPSDFSAPIIYIQHLTGGNDSLLTTLLQARTALKVDWAKDGEQIRPGVVYVAPPMTSIAFTPNSSIGLVPVATSHDILRSADKLFQSAAKYFGDSAVAVVLSGGSRDGAEGVKAVRDFHGTVLAQDKQSALCWGMPSAALDTGCVDFVLNAKDIAPVLIDLSRDGRDAALAIRAGLSEMRPSILPPSSMLNGTLSRILASAIRSDGADLGNIQLLNSAENVLAICSQCGFGRDFLDYFGSVNAEDDTACGRAMRSCMPISISDVQTDAGYSEYRDIAAIAGYRAVQSTPIVTSTGNLLGILSTHYRKAREFSKSTSEVMSQHAQLAARMIQRFS